MKLAILCLFLTTAINAMPEIEWLKTNNHKKVEYYETWNMTEPFESLQGTYHLEHMPLRDFPPVLATLWNVEKEFNVVAWPPKYCHAVQICFVKSSFTNVNVLHIQKGLCTKTIHFYPAIGQVVVESETAVNQMSTVAFRTKESKLVIEAYGSSAKNTEDFKAAQKKDIDLGDLSGHKVLLLTNSRFCFAHVSQATRQPTFQTLFHPRRYSEVQSLPKKMTSYNQPLGVYSIFSPKVIQPSTKAMDLIPVLKTLKPLPAGQVQQSKTCSSFLSKSLNPLKHSIGLMTVDSWQMQKSQDTNEEFMQSFNIKIGKCSWLRVWVSTSKFSAYENDMKPEDTVDFFFDQQFFVGADQDEAKPLYGDASKISMISFKRFTQNPYPSSERLVELSYGRDRGPAFPFKEYFHMGSMHENNVNIHIIKAPECEAVLVPGALTYRFASATRPETNLLSFTNCEHTVLGADARLSKDLDQRKDNIPRSLKNTP